MFAPPARRALGLAAMCLAAFGLTGCSPAAAPEAAETEAAADPEAETAGAPQAVESTVPESAEFTATAATAEAAETTRLQPADLHYRGAFRLPGPSGGSDWTWCGDGLAYRPDGDPEGAGDGYPGSLFGFGQPFADIRAGHFTDYEIPRADLAYLPPQGDQARPKLYFCFGQHMHETHMHETFKGPTHCWCEVDLASPKTAGPWTVGGLTEYVTADYLCEIPKAWADKHVAGMRLATGRFRDGGQGSQGPTLFALAPWQHGNPPEAGADLSSPRTRTVRAPSAATIIPTNGPAPPG